MPTQHIHFTLQEVDHDPFGPIWTEVASTETQREIFTSVKIGGASANCAYNESVSLRFKGMLDVKAMRQAFNLVVARHEALRAQFSEDGTKVRIAQHLDLPIDFTDLSNQYIEDQQEMLSVFAKKEVTTEFRLEKGPLIRAHICRLADEDWLLTVTGHHIVCDGWSLSLLLQDLSKFYTGIITGVVPVMEPAISFVQYATHAARYQHSISCQATEEYWLKQYRGDIPTMEFPPDKNRPLQRTFNAQRIDVQVPSELVSSLRLTARKNGVSFVTLFLASFEMFVSKVSRQQDVVIGLPAAGQNAEGFLNLVSHCVNLLPLRSNVSPQESFSDYLQKRRQYLFDAFDNQLFTFGSLVRKLNIHRDPSRIPLVPIVINVDIGFTEGFHFNDLTFEFITNQRSFENFELFLNASGSNDKLTLECTFNTDLFDSRMMQLRMQEFIRVLEQITVDSTQTIANLSPMTAQEKDLLKLMNTTMRAYPSEKGIHELISEKSAAFPDKIAITGVGSPLTYAEVERLSNRFAAKLMKKGIKPGDYIGVCLPRTTQLPVVLLGIMKAGAAYVPLDPAFPVDRLLLMLDDSQAPIVVTTDEQAGLLNLPAERLLILNEHAYETENGHPFAPVPVQPNQLAYVLYTSGSTGKPKGVMVKHHGVINLMEDLRDRFPVTADDVFLAITTISFDISVLEMFLPLLNGARVHVAAKEQGLDASWLEKTINDERITFFQATPASWELLLASNWKGAKHLNVLCGGEALRIALAERLVNLNKSLWNLYGPTETTIWSTARQVTVEDIRNARSGFVTIGKPVANTLLYIVDEQGKPVPLGVDGELWIGGEGVAVGYLNRPDLNAEKFTDNPFAEGRIYRTGDRVLVDLKGDLHFLNRFDHQVKVRGYRIELGEIESALNATPGVQQGVVVARTGHTGDTYLAAYFLGEGNGPDVNKAELQEKIVQAARKEMSKLLPDYMVPTAWALLDEFPHTPNNKVDRKALPDPQVLRNESAAEEDESTLTPTEKKILGVWKQILNLNDVRVEDDFFELGGHSLLAVRMMVDLEHMTGVKLPLAVLFTNPTVRALSRLYDAPPQEEIWKPIVEIKATGSRNPIYFAHGISGNVFKYHALAHLLDEDQPSYGLQAAGLDGKETPLDVMADIAAHHIREILKFQPEGPYAIAGGSFGGYLAYEIACQLRDLGKEVNFLCLFDLEAADELQFMPQGVKQIKGATLFAERVFKRAINFITADKEERKKYLAAKMNERKGENQEADIESWLDKHKMVELIGEESASYFRNVEDACYRAMMSYKIRPYDRDITLVRAKEGYFNNTYAHDLGWSHFTKGKVEVHVVSGDHNSIFWDPNVYELAKCCDSTLNRVFQKQTA